MPANGQIGVVTGEMQAAVSNFMANAASIDEQLMRTTSQGIALESSWWGQSNVAFEQAMQEWKIAAQNVHQALVDLARATQTTNTSFMETDAAAARLFPGL
jgi:WXG100 family type VII secretion target